jgi:hypothetical protein
VVLGCDIAGALSMGFDVNADVKNPVRAAWKLFLSLFKSDWELSDYPIVIREQQVDPSHGGTRLKHYRYNASIVNWWVMTGGGDTRREALQELDKTFANAKADREKKRKPLPRPGTHVPIEFAARQRVSGHHELAEDFIRRVLNLDWAWISDESSLWDFHEAEGNGALIAKIKEVYGVDVSDIGSGKLSEILERIATEQRSTKLP